MLRACAL
jgi:hypothetical protein